MKICKFYAETARRGWCSNVDCLLEKCYFDDNLNSCEFFEPTKCEKESYPSTLKYDKVETVKLMPDNDRSIDKRTSTIQNCDKIILKPKSLEDRKVYFYDEYDCGGIVSSYIAIVPEYIDLWDYSFIYWLRNEIEDYM